MSTARNVVRSSELARNEGRNDPITYRGSDIEQLLPRIRAELGPDAIVIRQREGLDGGFGGFFQKRCVEVVARRATPGVDAYDGHAPAPLPPGAADAPEPPAPAIAEIMRVASPFIDQLRAAELTAEPQAAADPELAAQPVAEQRVTGAFGTSAYTIGTGGALAAVQPRDEEEPIAVTPAAAPALQLVADAGPAAAPVPAPARQPAPAERSPAAAVQEQALVAAGIAPRRAAELIAATISHALPFTPRRTLKRAAREALARRIPLAPPVASGARAIAFAGAGGAGKTLCAARLAAAYEQHSDLAVTALSVDELDPRAIPARPAAGEQALTVIDTRAVSPGAPADVKKLAAALRRLGSPEVHVTVPATLSKAAVCALLDGYAPLKPAAIVLTHLDEVGHAGPVVDEAIARGVPISYTSDGSAPDGFAPADPAALAARILA